MKRILLYLLIAGSFTTVYADGELKEQVDKSAEQIESKVIEWRRHFHQFPELSNREFKTAEKIAEHLENLDLDVRTGVAHTGVVGLLKGGKPRPLVGLRADNGRGGFLIFPAADSGFVFFLRRNAERQKG